MYTAPYIRFLWNINIINVLLQPKEPDDAQHFLGKTALFTEKLS